MRPHLSQSQSRPQISTMPRRKTEAAAYLELYKLVTERQRLEQELAGLDQRRDRIVQRLATLNQQTQALDASAQALREGQHSAPAPGIRASASATDPYTLLYLEY